MSEKSIRGTPAGILTLRVMKAERIAKLLDDLSLIHISEPTRPY